MRRRQTLAGCSCGEPDKEMLQGKKRKKSDTESVFDRGLESNSWTGR